MVCISRFPAAIRSGETELVFGTIRVNKLINPSKILISSSSSVCSAQGQVFHCKLRHQGCTSAQRQVLNRKFRNQGCSFTGMKTVATIPVLQCEKEEEYSCYLLLSLKCWMATHKTHPPRWPNPSINKRKREREREGEGEGERERERERNTRGPAHNLTHRNVTHFGGRTNVCPT